MPIAYDFRLHYIRTVEIQQKKIKYFVYKIKTASLSYISGLLLYSNGSFDLLLRIILAV